MTTTVTQKGQITIPVFLRTMFGLKPYSKVVLQAGRGYIKVKPVEDILDLAGTFKPKKKLRIDDARKALETSYHRF